MALSQRTKKITKKYWLIILVLSASLFSGLVQGAEVDFQVRKSCEASLFNYENKYCQEWQEKDIIDYFKKENKWIIKDLIPRCANENNKGHWCDQIKTIKEIRGTGNKSNSFDLIGNLFGTSEDTSQESGGVLELTSSEKLKDKIKNLTQDERTALRKINKNLKTKEKTIKTKTYLRSCIKEKNLQSANCQKLKKYKPIFYRSVEIDLQSQEGNDEKCENFDITSLGNQHENILSTCHKNKVSQSILENKINNARNQCLETPSKDGKIEGIPVCRNFKFLSYMFTGNYFAYLQFQQEKIEQEETDAACKKGLEDEDYSFADCVRATNNTLKEEESKIIALCTKGSDAVSPLACRVLRNILPEKDVLDFQKERSMIIGKLFQDCINETEIEKCKTKKEDNITLPQISQAKYSESLSYIKNNKNCDDGKISACGRRILQISDTYRKIPEFIEKLRNTHKKECEDDWKEFKERSRDRSSSMDFIDKVVTVETLSSCNKYQIVDIRGFWTLRQNIINKACFNAEISEVESHCQNKKYPFIPTSKTQDGINAEINQFNKKLNDAGIQAWNEFNPKNIFYVSNSDSLIFGVGGKNSDEKSTYLLDYTFNTDDNGNPITTDGDIQMRILIQKLVKFFKLIMIPIAILMIFWSGFQIIANKGGNEEIVNEKNSIYGVIIGLGVILFMFVIVDKIAFGIDGSIFSGDNTNTIAFGETTIEELNGIINLITSFVVIIALAFLILNVFAFVTHAQNEEEIKNIKTKIIYTVLGIFIVLSLRTITELIIIRSQDGESLLLPDSSGILDYLTSITNYFLGFIGVIAVCAIVYAGVRLISHFGDEEATTEAKNIIKYAVIGIVIAFSAWTIVRYFLVAGTV